MRTFYFICLFLSALLPYASPCRGKLVWLDATADAWLSDATESERNSSGGRVKKFKLKSVQEMAAIRFDVSAVKGKEILNARLFINALQSDRQIRYLRLSTINQNWEEGIGRKAYGPGDGATFNHADHASKRPWAWEGSQFCDAAFSSGQTLSSWAEIEKKKLGWISVEVDPKLIYAMAVGDSDGLAIQEGGTIALFNNFIQSSDSGQAPFLLIEPGQDLDIVPSLPRVKVEPDPERSSFTDGAIKITIEHDDDVFCWRVCLDGRLVERWRVKHPEPDGPTVFSLENLEPSKECEIEIVAVSKGGGASPPFRAIARTSKALDQPPALGDLAPPGKGSPPPVRNSRMKAWAFPGLVKISPIEAVSMHGDLGSDGVSPSSANAVWDGERISLFGIRGEYVDFQLCIEKYVERLENIKIYPPSLKGPDDSVIGGAEIELFKNWYAKTKAELWQPAYQVPLKQGEAFEIPDLDRKIKNQQNQTVYIDVYIPKNAKPGKYSGAIQISAKGVDAFELPVTLEVQDFLMPDELAFLPEMNAYSIRENYMDFWRLAHQNRCAANFWVFRPKLSGSGKDIKVDWEDYDNIAGPLLSGEAFAGNRRSGRPAECLYLPFSDSWPTPLSKDTYSYDGHWPGKGESRDHLVRHYLESPYIGDALSQEYKDAFFAVQKQFIKHFEEKGWNKTEMQLFFGGKKTHRTDYGSNMWWTTDEPCHWDDWLALRFFDELWTKGRTSLGASEKLWPARADISRPQWMGRFMDGVLNISYYGGFDNLRQYRRAENIKRDSGIEIRAYGSANAHDRSNTETVSLMLSMWLNGAEAFLSWQTQGNDKSLDKQESAMGNAIFAPGKRFGLPVVGDMRLKAFRKGEQIIEYLALAGKKHNFSRKKLKAIIENALEIKSTSRASSNADNADALMFAPLKAWQITELRKKLLELLNTPQHD